MSWIDEIAVALRLARRGVLVLLETRGDHALSGLVRTLLPAFPALRVVVETRSVVDAAHGAVLVLCPRATDAEWLNAHRPLFASKALRVVIWASPEVAASLATRAPDFFDWISSRDLVPPCPPPAGVQAFAGGETLVEWRGGDLDAAFAAGLPGRRLERVSAAAMPWDLEAAARRRPWLAFTEVDGLLRLRRVRWAMAKAGRRGRAILVEPTLRSPGWCPVDGRCVELREAAQRVGGRIAALTALEPDRVDLCEALLADHPAAEVEAALLEGRDVELGVAAGRVDPEAVARGAARPVAWRALGHEPAVRRRRSTWKASVTRRVKRGAPVDADELAAWASFGGSVRDDLNNPYEGPSLGWATEAYLRGTTGAQHADLLHQSAYWCGDPAAGWWGRQSGSGDKPGDLRFVGNYVALGPFKPRPAEQGAELRVDLLGPELGATLAEQDLLPELARELDDLAGVGMFSTTSSTWAAAAALVAAAQPRGDPSADDELGASDTATLRKDWEAWEAGAARLAERQGTGEHFQVYQMRLTAAVHRVAAHAFAEADPVLAQLVALGERLFGPVPHPYHAVALALHALVLARTGRAGEATRPAEEALRIIRKQNVAYSEMVGGVLTDFLRLVWRRQGRTPPEMGTAGEMEDP